MQNPGQNKTSDFRANNLQFSFMNLFNGKELFHQWQDILETFDSSITRIPWVVVNVIRQLGQWQQKTQVTIIFFGGTECLQAVQTFHHLTQNAENSIVQSHKWGFVTKSRNKYHSLLMTVPKWHYQIIFLKIKKSNSK